MSKHTPGPWFAVQDKANRSVLKTWHVFEQQYNGFKICDLGSSEVKESQDEANARLIAASPELLEATKDCLAIVEGIDIALKPHLKGMGDLTDSIFDLRAVRAKLQRLIAKAEGRE